MSEGVSARIRAPIEEENHDLTDTGDVPAGGADGSGGRAGDGGDLVLQAKKNMCTEKHLQVIEAALCCEAPALAVSGRLLSLCVQY